jgi:ABC transporter substrate binding protein (PQQ-dependent alcohol dehydrogenase system)
VAAELGLREVRFAAAEAGVKIELRRYSGKNSAELVTTLKTWLAEGIQFVLIDAPGETIKILASHAKDPAVLLFNLTARESFLRQESCQSNLLHIIPDQTMLMDALAQYLISKKWRKVLTLKGRSPEDEKLHSVFKRSAKRFGLKIVAEKSFLLGRDPRQRSKNNIALLTSGKNYDVVFVADTQGEFARAVPFQIQKPRPVVGSAGLVPDGWIWSWDRHGAPQLNKRFLRKAKRWMTAYDWSAWMAIKTIGEAVQRTNSSEIKVISDYLLGNEIILDGFKGYPLSFRDWNRQLRQPVFLTTTNWVVARAPLEGFLHEKNNLDTLGLDRKETRCGL